MAANDSVHFFVFSNFPLIAFSLGRFEIGNMTTFPMTPQGMDHVLVASPSSVVRQRVLASLMPSARRVGQARGGAEALLHLEKGIWQRLFLDRRLPDLDAEELSETVRQRYPAVEVVLLDDANDAQVGGLRSANGVDEGLCSAPQEVSDEEARTETTSGGSGCGEEAGLRDLETAGDVFTLPRMVGSSAAMQAVYRKVRLVAARATTVLIAGPTGSGKELVARALHDLSPRAGRNFAVVNCAAIPETLLEAELFGYSRGAFTGALQAYGGRIQAAHQGTLFLDEIGDMPLSLQPKLLRFLEQKELQRLGSSQVVHVDVRVISASNADLLKLAGEGKFREDLYYRLSAFPIEIPALRERPEDVGELAEHFLERFAPELPGPVMSSEALRLLQGQSWPGNVRELQNVVERALILACGEGTIRPAHLMLGGGVGRVRK